VAVEITPGAATPPAVPLREVELLAQEIMAAREKNLADKIGRAEKRDRVWFGDIHDCDRHNYYSMAEGDQRTRWNPWVQAKLDAGREWEQITKRELMQLGYEPMLAGEVVEIKDKLGKVLARGRTDLSLARMGDERKRNLIPVEMKQMQVHVWESINEWRDLLRNPWTRKYVRQLMLYMVGKGVEEGMFFLGDFQGHWKLLPVVLDYAFAEDALQKVERATAAASRGEAPERITYDHMLCGSCQFAHVCIPDVRAVPAKRIENNKLLEEMMERREQLSEKAKEFKKLDEAIKKFFDGIKDGVFTVGNFIVTRKPQNRTKYDIPDDVKAKYASPNVIYINKAERFKQPDPETIFLEPKRLIGIDED
jgi:hypothetical protein